MTFIRLCTKLLLLSILILGMACNKPTTIQDTSKKTMLNVSYGQDPMQVMDIYLPNGRSMDTTKVVLLIHGGGWVEGDKSDYKIDDLRVLFPTYAIFNLNYRLGNETNKVNPFPAQELDMKAAVQFIYDHRSEYIISNNWCYLGGSAGGHLALLQAYKYPSPITPKAVIDYYGPTDIADLYNYNINNTFFQPLIHFLLSGTPAENPTLYASSSPINYVNAACPPTLILQGQIDKTVPYTESETLHNKLTNLGVVNKYVLYPLQGHGFIGADAGDSYYQIALFLAVHMPN